MPFHDFVSTQCKEGIDQERRNNILKTSIEDIYNNQLITNKEIQNIEILNGSHYLWIEQSETMSRKIIDFIENIN